MIHEDGDWKDYRKRFNLSKDDEIDLHFGRRDRSISYEEVMGEVYQLVIDSLRKAQENGRPHFMFIHGYSTSGPGKTTARSIVRGYMRSSEATPFIVRAECRQHPTVFLAKIKFPVPKASLAVRDSLSI